MSDESGSDDRPTPAPAEIAPKSGSTDASTIGPALEQLIHPKVCVNGHCTPGMIGATKKG